MMRISTDYLELTVNDIAAAKAFYVAAFGFQFTDYGPAYASEERVSPAQFALREEALPAAPLPAFRTDDLVAALDAVTAAGGQIVAPIFAYPGGQRFEFTDPAGNRIAIYQPD